MDVDEAIRSRRAYRALDPVDITDETLASLMEAASLAPSCMNNQPWRMVFARSPEALSAVKASLTRGNFWAGKASLIVAVSARAEDDCRNPDGREHYLFDAGMSTAFVILRATEMGLVAHPISGYDQTAARKALGIPEEYTLIALVIVGRHGTDTTGFSEKQLLQETTRPARKPFPENMFIDGWGGR
jgi:nitroreductase